MIEIIPASGPAGEAYPLQVTIRGRGFDPAGNIVNFGAAKVLNVPSADGKQITFYAPKLLTVSAGPAPLVLGAGDYPVTVTTAAGTSKPIVFTLTRGP